MAQYTREQIEETLRGKGYKYFTSEKGYDGFLAKLRYYSRTLNPREVYELYKEGPNKGIFGNFLNKYKLKFSYYVDNEYGGGITI